MASEAIYYQDTASIPDSLMPVRNKLQDRMNTLRCVIDSKQSLVRRVSEEMKRLIDEKSQLIIRQLEGIWEDANQRADMKRDEVNKNIEAIKKHRSEIEKFFKNINQTPCLDQISKGIENAKNEMDIDIPYVKLSCHVLELRENIAAMYRCDHRTVKFVQNNPIQLKWTSCERGQRENQLSVPWGISIDCTNDDIYVADCGGNRIQVFSANGEWIKSLKDEEMVDPENILFVNNSMFIQCSWGITKFHRCTLKRESYRSYQYPLSGICTDNTHIYMGEIGDAKLTVLTPELEEVERMPLNTQFKQKHTGIKDLSLARDEIYVCFNSSNYSIQAFTKQGRLTRCIVHKDILKYAHFFCLDQQFNIFVSDGRCQVKTFSNDGKLLYTFGNEGSAPGEFTQLWGISVNDLSHIITVDMKGQNKLQAFSYQ